MKKLIVTAVALTMTLALAACSGEQTKVPEETGSSAPAQNENSSASAENTATIQSYMGQVSNKVGNDITVSLGELVLDDSDGSGESYYVDENGEMHPMDNSADTGSGGELTIMVPVPDDAAAEGAEDNIGEAEQLPIAFTGEVREFTIPAGAKITNAMGKEVSLDNVTKGSLVQLIVNESTGVVEHLMVM